MFSKGFFPRVVKSRDCVVKIKPSPKLQILDSSKLSEFSGNSFKFDENGKEFSNGQKTLWEKEKLLITNNFSFSCSVFKICTADTLKPGLVWGRIKFVEVYVSWCFLWPSSSFYAVIKVRKP